MKNTPQIIGVRALLTFVVFAWTPQQMFAHHILASKDPQINHPGDPYPWKAVIITEIMADPSPPRELPEVEFIELYNRSSLAIPLENWHISDPSRSASLPDVILDAHEYLVITSKTTGFTGDNIILVPNLPSLNNAGDSLLLTDPTGKGIDFVAYTDHWYRDAQRGEGGWSLEVIDLENTCEEMGNWSVSEDEHGGTPGQQNSIAASNPDVAPPEVLSVFPIDKFTLRVSFNEKLTTTALSPAHWAVTPALEVASTFFADSSLSNINLQFSQPISAGVFYALTVHNIASCAGNVLNESRVVHFALPEVARPGDIVINELLFNPIPNGVDFVELFNASQKYVDLNGWAIGAVNSDGELEKAIIHHPTFIHPGNYLAFSSDNTKLQSQYLAADTTLVQLDIPAYPDDHGVVVLFDDGDSVIDRFEYDSDLHNIFVRDPEGVSLERVSPNDPADRASNWTSASSSAGFATPGRQNSVLHGDPGSERPIAVVPSAFTPLSGQPNFAEIRYHFAQAGYIATVDVYDNRGMLIRHLANSAVLGAEGMLRWEGDNDNGHRVQSGYYMIWFQVFAADGTLRLFRHPVAISPRY